LCVQTYYEALHRIPEISEKEYKTSEYIFNALKTMGYSPIKTADTGVYADIVSNENASWIVFRADIDALPIQEETALPYISTHAGFMHACGHDAHSAILLEAARILKNENVQQNIRFLFQPAEETTTGAAKMIKSGVLPENTAACFALHVWPGVPKGHLTTTTGAMMASSDVFRIHIHGKSVHCAQRASGKDALHTAAEIASGIYRLSEELEAKKTLLFLGSMHSGKAHNIVPDTAELYGTLRTYSVEEQMRCKELLENTCRAIAEKHGTTANIVWEGGCPPVCNDTKVVEALQKIVPELSTDAARTYAGEDFAEYLQLTPGALFWLGIGDTPPLHSINFFVPTEVLPIGVSLWKNIALQKWE